MRFEKEVVSFMQYCISMFTKIESAAYNSEIDFVHWRTHMWAEIESA